MLQTIVTWKWQYGTFELAVDHNNVIEEKRVSFPINMIFCSKITVCLPTSNTVLCGWLDKYKISKQFYVSSTFRLNERKYN